MCGARPSRGSRGSHPARVVNPWVEHLRADPSCEARGAGAVVPGSRPCGRTSRPPGPSAVSCTNGMKKKIWTFTSEPGFPVGLVWATGVVKTRRAASQRSLWPRQLSCHAFLHTGSERCDLARATDLAEPAFPPWGNGTRGQGSSHRVVKPKKLACARPLLRAWGPPAAWSGGGRAASPGASSGANVQAAPASFCSRLITVLKMT